MEDRIAHVRPASARSVPRGQDFSLWRIRGRKRLLHAGADLILSASHGPQCLRACLSPELNKGSACRLSLPNHGDARCIDHAIQTIAGDADPALFRRASRLDILHMRALQALDALQGGCGQRGVAWPKPCSAPMPSLKTGTPTATCAHKCAISCPVPKA